MAEKKWIKPVIILTVVVLTVLLLLWVNSFSLMLYGAGLNRDGVIYVLEQKEINNGLEVKMLQTTTKDGELALVWAQKNKLGIWQIENMESTTEEIRFLDMSWMEPSVMRRYSEKEIGIRERGWHFVFCGDDAIKLVELYPEQLPENAAVNIQQAGEFYLIHVVVYDDDGFLIEVRAALEENGCVEPMS